MCDRDAPDDGYTALDAARWFVLFALALLALAIVTGNFSPSCSTLLLRQATYAGRSTATGK